MMFPPDVPDGLRYQDDYLSSDEEAELLKRRQRLRDEMKQLHNSLGSN